jgi:hypothetical protein
MFIQGEAGLHVVSPGAVPLRGFFVPRSGPWIARNNMQRDPSIQEDGFTPAS